MKTHHVYKLHSEIAENLNLLHLDDIGWDRSSFLCCLDQRNSTDCLLLLQISSGVVWQSRDLQLSCTTLYLLSPRLCFSIVLERDLFFYRDDSLTS